MTFAHMSEYRSFKILTKKNQVTSRTYNHNKCYYLCNLKYVATTWFENNASHTAEYH